MSVTIQLNKVGKRFRREWIFKDINFAFEQGKQYAIMGPNGSGKSTFLKLLSGHLSPSKGKVSYAFDNQAIDDNEIYRYLAYSAPYIDLIEEFTLQEAIQFHQQFKPFLPSISTSQIIQLLSFEKSRNKAIRDFSSGMKQRLKLVLSICSDTPILLLDEPTTNLDKQGIQWYRQLIDQHTQNRLLIIASNVKVDFDFCNHHLEISQFK